MNLGEPVELDPGTRPYRYGLLAKELARRGHQVIRWAPTFDHYGARVRPEAEGLHAMPAGGSWVALFDAGSYRGGLGLQRILFHWRSALRFRQLARKLPVPDVIVCSSPVPELAAAVALGFGARVPVVIDIRDLWPDALFRHLRGLRVLARGLAGVWWRGWNRVAFRRAAAITGVSDAYVDWALGIAGRMRTGLDRAYYIGAPRINQIPTTRSAPAKTGIAFFGSLSGHFDFTQLVAAAEGLPDLDFHVCGTGPGGPSLQEAAERFPNIKCWGWRTPTELREIAAVCAIGLAPYAADAVMSSTNKLAEYLSFGLPVLGSLRGDAMGRVVDGGAGWAYDPSVRGALMERLRELLASPDALETARRRVPVVFEERFDGERIAIEFASLLEALAQSVKLIA